MVTDGNSGRPIGGASVSVVGTGQTVVTGVDGRYHLSGLPEGASLTFAADGYAALEDPVVNRSAVDVALTPTRVTGPVLDLAGEPVGNALVKGAGATAVTRADGSFAVDGAPGVGEVRVSASGFDAVTVPVDGDRSVRVQLERITIRASYINQSGLGDPTTLGEMIQTVNSTELNAIVLDIK
ncbi:MAG: hypothetical protein AVDCRST_MAG33-2056 [uncultured Thermomicrobiales bacterium]|uniref:TonB-dependent receptor n=1 Tax=uncultured Thermomicrobiales bacterium TaxID=1645740 RepID=A0A6J4V367_9BACT|nr:MAG: hypothetical protein AVDCRST_MAG33-2056 [uncultured Thermomicrobiales bacterium]